MPTSKVKIHRLNQIPRRDLRAKPELEDNQSAQDTASDLSTCLARTVDQTGAVDQTSVCVFDLTRSFRAEQDTTSKRKLESVLSLRTHVQDQPCKVGNPESFALCPAVLDTFEGMFSDHMVAADSVSVFGVAV